MILYLVLPMRQHRKNFRQGQNYLIVQHPMADNQFDIVVSGDYVRDLKLNNGTNLFKTHRPGKPAG